LNARLEFVRANTNNTVIMKHLETCHHRKCI